MQPKETASARIVAVSRLSVYLRNILNNDKWLRNIGVRGEISNLSRSGGNVYFNLKDADALLGCVVWSDRAADLPAVDNGQQVIAYGEITAYPKASKYQLIAYRVEQEGVGRLHELYEKLKSKLEAEGAFATERKRPIAMYPFSLALVSSKGAAGATDFLKILRARAPYVEVTFCETPVQGVGAATEIVRAINRASRLDVDCVVVARGGGSYEDLFAFNTEDVARAILRAPCPVITGIGHETDLTIADLVADRRAETPSAAAHIVAPVPRDELLRSIAARATRIERLARGRIVSGRTHLERAVGRSAVTDPARITGIRRQHVDRAVGALATRMHEAARRHGARLQGLERRLDRLDPKSRVAERRRAFDVMAVRLHNAGERRLREKAERFKVVAAQLGGKDPEAILQRGYAIVRYEGKTVRDALAIPVGATVSAKVARGTLVARVERKESDGKEGG
ncbi:MAG: exodeoxyribonuclease VII large subunit [Vulcanimicrobiaceae bacterium]